MILAPLHGDEVWKGISYLCQHMPTDLYPTFCTDFENLYEEDFHSFEIFAIQDKLNQLQGMMLSNRRFVDRGIVRLDALVIAPEFTRQGLAKRAVWLCTEALHWYGCKHLLINLEASQCEFFRSLSDLGFRCLGSYQRAEHDYLVLDKPLRPDPTTRESDLMSLCRLWD